MIRKNKGKIILSSFITLLPLFAGLLLWDRLPDRFGSKPFTVFGLPLIMLAVYWLCLFCTSLDQRQADQNPKALRIIFWIIPYSSLFAGGITYSALLGREFHPSVITPVMLGIMFLFIGNYLPKTRPNHTLGIRIPWTLGNEENWIRTHRFGGKVWVICGLLLLLCAFLPAAPATAVSVCVMLAAITAPIVFSWRLRRRHKEEGVPYATVAGSKMGKRAVGISVTIVAVSLIVTGILLFSGNIDIVCKDNSLKIQASWWRDLEIACSDIDRTEYRTDVETGMRTNGFGSARLLMGTFHNDEFGTYTRYSYTGKKACIVLEVDGEILVLGTEDDAKTRELYENLSDMIE